MRLTAPVADCSGATGPLFRTYSYGEHFEFTALGGRFQAVARAKDGRTANVPATFDACSVFGSSILGKFHEYALPDCPRAALARGEV